MTESLRKKAERGALWSFVNAAGSRMVQVVIGIILARVLLPAEFGLIGMLTIFMAVGQVFLQSGFGVALIQKKEATQADTSSVFYFNLIIGLALAGLLCLAAPWIAAFYDEPILTPLTRAMSLLLVIGSFGVVQTAMLTRAIAFKIQAKVSLVSVLCSGTLGVIMAYSGFGVWSLVGQQISMTLLNVVLLWVFNRWRPSLVFSFHALRQMFTFGSRMLASNLLNGVFENIYYPVIGKLFRPADLGFYTRAQHLVDFPSRTVVAMATQVSLPVFSAIQDDLVRLKSGLQKVLCLLVFVNTPLMVILAAAASPLVEVLITAKWLPCVGYLQLLCLQGIFLPLHALNLNVLMAKGRSDLFLRLEVLKKALTVCNVIVSWRWGITAIIVGQLLACVISYFLNSYYSGKLLGYPAWSQLRDTAGYFLAAAVAGLGAYALQYVGLPNKMLLLAVQVVCGFAAYLLLCGLFRLPALGEGWRLVAERMSFRPAIKA